MLQSMGLQTVRCDLAAKKQQGSDLSQEFGDGA